MRIERLGKLLSALLALILAGTAAIAEIEADFGYHFSTGAMAVQCGGLAPENDYVFMVFDENAEIDNPSLEDLIWIDLLPASDEGVLNVAVVGAQPCTVFLGGIFDEDESPIYLGRFSEEDMVFDGIKLPQQLTVIEDEAFSGCAFNYIYIGENVTRIGDNAFKDSKALCGVLIENDNIDIGKDAFAGCDQLVIICGKDSNAHAYAVDNGIDFSFTL